MIRPRDLLLVLENEDAPPVAIEDTGGALLLDLMVHMFFADRELHDKELQVLQKIVGSEIPELRAQVSLLAESSMNFDKLAEVYPSREDRLDIITLAEHGFWADNEMRFAEMDVLDKLADVLEISER